MPPDELSPTIFRHGAVERYAQAQERSLPPQVSAPRSTRYLWACLLALLVGGGAWLWSIRLPVYVSGTAVVTRLKKDTIAAPGDVTLVALLPAERLAQLEAGQELRLRAGNEKLPPETIFVVMPAVVRTADVFGPATLAQAGLAPDKPVAVAVARLTSRTAGTPAEHIGDVYHVDVVVGTRPALSLLPPLAPFFEDAR